MRLGELNVCAVCWCIFIKDIYTVDLVKATILCSNVVTCIWPSMHSVHSVKQGDFVLASYAYMYIFQVGERFCWPEKQLLKVISKAKPPAAASKSTKPPAAETMVPLQESHVALSKPVAPTRKLPHLQQKRHQLLPQNPRKHPQQKRWCHSKNRMLHHPNQSL